MPFYRLELESMSEFPPYRSKKNNKGSTGRGRMFNSNASYIIHRPDSLRVNWDILRLDRTNCSVKERLNFFSNPSKPLLAKLKRKNSIAEGHSIIPGELV